MFDHAMTFDATTATPQQEPHLTELTFRGIVIGALITMVFTASNIYLGLKVGMTFSSSIPAAVISMAVLSFFARSSILENNMVQTQASAAGTLSAIIFVLPALLMAGYWSDFPFWQTLMVCSAGGILGVVFSIPLRRAMVVNSTLPYPEGVAAAEILKVGHSNKVEDQGNARWILLGSIVSAVVAFVTTGLHLLADKASYWFNTGKAAIQLPIGFSLALVSAGYLMGVCAGVAMLIGAIIAWFGFVPYLSMQEAVATTDLSALISHAQAIWTGKVRFIGAGLIAVAAVWTLLTLLRPMFEGIRLSFQSLRDRKEPVQTERTDLDISSRTLLLVLVGALVVLGVAFYSFVKAAPLPAWMGWALVALAVITTFIIGFFIAAACGYMAGLIGSSNSPISGIGVIAIIVVSSLLLFISVSSEALGGPEGQRFAMALAIFITSAVVAVASISNDNLQDLKTGYLVKATPRNQQIALLIGCVVGALVIAPVLEVLYQAYGLADAPLPRPDMDTSVMLSAPQATLMTTIAKGIFSSTLDWSLIITGLVLGAIFIVIDTFLEKRKSVFRIPALAVGLGIYLPPDISIAIFIGSMLNGLLRLSTRNASSSKQQTSARRGILIASGFIVGESLIGVFMAIVILASLSLGGSDAPFGLDAFLAGMFDTHIGMVRGLAGLIVFVLVCGWFFQRVKAAAKSA